MLYRYQSVVIGNGLANQGSNPDVEVDITKPDVVIRTQISVLKDMTSRLKAAYSGNDISFDGEEANPLSQSNNLRPSSMIPAQSGAMGSFKYFHGLDNYGKKKKQNEFIYPSILPLFFRLVLFLSASIFKL